MKYKKKAKRIKNIILEHIHVKKFLIAYLIIFVALCVGYRVQATGTTDNVTSEEAITDLEEDIPFSLGVTVDTNNDKVINSNDELQNAWAPDIIYNTAMEKYCMYMSIVDGSKKCCMLALASCSNISESYAEKINKAAEAGEHYTLEKVKEDLGDEAVDITVVGSGVLQQNKQDNYKPLKLPTWNKQNN